MKTMTWPVRLAAIGALVACALVALLYGPLRAAQPEPAGWSTLAPLPLPRSEMAVAELEGRIYVVGGYPQGRVPSDAVQVYDARTDTWEIGPAAPIPIHHAMAAAAAGRLYLIGGEMDGAGSGRPARFADTVYALDLASGRWEPRARMPSARSGGGAAVIDDKVYVAGGRPPRGHDFAVYDAASDRWTELPNLPTQRNHLAVGAIGGKVYVAGGRFGGGVGSEMTAVLEIFDPRTGEWSAGPPLTAPRAGVTSIVANGCLFVIGGEGNDADPKGIFAENDAFDPRASRWHALEPMAIPTHGLTGAAFLNGRIHVPGGATTRGGDTGSTVHQVYRPALDCR